MDDPQQTWDDYYSRIKTRKVDEATKLWENMLKAEVSSETVFTMDFTHFCDLPEKLKELGKQLSENYELEFSDVDDKGYQFLSGTTRPYGNELSQVDFIGWVEFMCDVAQSYSCVFSSFTIESPELGLIWSNKDVESEKG
ncbi:hypothetical protein ACFOD0_14655 [Shewanella intestini]|uniref:Uncharacterized protein n=1 Tax=Shewanella intestini TaxID=2017544 RepID=A0ABS5I4I3_9GAMM|nr:MULTISPECIES: hypothetical protein [Shewanella]MBR9728938.1 hypothetical protein [Shewanella intestini]MRG36997.1 hypothetical protein [Shewanella sp. XMDDZSB0408]